MRFGIAARPGIHTIRPDFLALQAEKRGFVVLWFLEGDLSTGGGATQTDSSPAYSGMFSALAYATAATSRILKGASATSLINLNPEAAATAASHLSVLSNGRLLLGIRQPHAGSNTAQVDPRCLEDLETSPPSAQPRLIIESGEGHKAGPDLLSVGDGCLTPVTDHDGPQAGSVHELVVKEGDAASTSTYVYEVRASGSADNVLSELDELTDLFLGQA